MIGADKGGSTLYSKEVSKQLFVHFLILISAWVSDSWAQPAAVQAVVAQPVVAQPAQTSRVLGKSLKYNNQYRYAGQAQLAIDGQLLGQCFAYLITKRPYRVSPQRRNYPYLLDYLSGSVKQHYATGKEDGLKEWVLRQPDKSVTPFSIFEKALELNQNDAFLALLTVHECVRREARWYRNFVKYPSSDAKMQAFFNKMVDIRGDLEERGEGHTGDHRGSWYRIWGTMLNYVNEAAIDEPSRMIPKEGCISVEDLSMTRVNADLTAVMAEVLKPLIMYGNETDHRKIEINQVGNRVAEAMLSALGDPKKRIGSRRPCDESRYLKNIEPVIEKNYERAPKDSKAVWGL